MRSELSRDDRHRAWEKRLQHDPRIWFSAPGSRHYQCRSFSNHPNSFANVSVTGTACALKCEHCNAGLLQSMIPAETPGKMRDVVDRLIERGCKGILVSGGSDSRGAVPLRDFEQEIAYARSRGLKVLVHTGILWKETALMLKECGVDQVLIDVIGHPQTIRDVYHLDHSPAEYLRSMLVCREAGIDCAPHVVAGLHFGHILGEYEALRMIQEVEPKALVLVILMPRAGTAMSMVAPPGAAEVEEVMAAARIWNPDVFLSLGCAKPAGEYKRDVEKAAIDCGFNGMAFPCDAAIDYARGRGLIPVFTEHCCSMAGMDEGGISRPAVIQPFVPAIAFEAPKNNN